MNSDLVDNAAPSSDDLRHENDYDAYQAAEDVNAFYREDYGGEEAEGAEDELFVGRAGEDVKSQATELRDYSKASLFDFVYISKGHEQEEEEEESLQGGEADDGFSPVDYDQTRFRDAPLTDEQRQDIAHKLRDLFDEANVLMIVNKFLHKNYIDLNRKSPSMANALDKFDETLVFEDPRYQTTLESFAQTRDDVDERRSLLAAELESLESRCSAAESTYAETFEDLLSRQCAVAKKTKPPKYDKETWLAEVERLLENQRQRAAEVGKIRLAHVRLQSKLAKLLGRLKQFDSLGPGFSMMDYEYLLKRKDIYSDRRDEQFENIKRLKEKNLACAAISRHIAEETDLYDEKVMKNSNHLDVLVGGNKRERSAAVELAKTKVAISKGMTRLKEEIGLLQYPYLLRKMERDLREIGKLKRRSHSLQAKMIADAKIIAKADRW